MTDLEWSPVVVRLGDLSHWAENPVTLSKAQAKKLLKSTEKLGRMQTLAIGPQNGDGKHPLYDGHQRVNVWGAAFGMELQVNALQSSRPLTDEERHQVPIMLRTAMGSLDWDALAGWDANNLMEWGFDSDMLDGWKRDIAALGNLIESEAPEPQDAEPQIDRAEELQEKWQVKAGDLWRIGEHRLLCGDSTKREDIERIMQGEKPNAIVTDPPYGVGVIYESFDDSAENAKILINRFMPILQAFDCPIALTSGHRLMWDYPRPAWVMAWIHPAGMGRNPWGFTQFNPILVYGKCPYLSNGLGSRPDSIVMAVDREGESIHPTSKPIKVWNWLVERLSIHSGDVILDPFVGSGTTIVACENLGRKCRAIEISPAYCAVTLERISTAFPALTIERVT